MARPTKYTPDVIERIVKAIELGATYEHAANYGGISYETFNQWRDKKSEFSEVIKAAEGKAVIGWLTKIEAAATEGTWQAAAWKAERRYPQDYGKTVTENHHTGKDGEPIRVILDTA